MVESDTLSNMREQIKANATLLFPTIVAAYQQQHQAANSYLYVPASAAFEIVILNVTTATPLSSPQKASTTSTASPNKQARAQAYQAYLTYAGDTGAKRAAQGAACGTVDEALRCLLDTTGKALASKTLAVFTGEGFGEWKQFGSGYVDEEAAVQ